MICEGWTILFDRKREHLCEMLPNRTSIRPSSGEDEISMKMGSLVSHKSLVPAKLKNIIVSKLITE